MIFNDIHKSSSLAKVSMEAELTFLLLLRLCDDYGVAEYNIYDLLDECYRRRNDVTPERFKGWLNELIAQRCLIAFDCEGITYLWAQNWEKYQSINHRSKFRFPAYDPKKHHAHDTLPDTLRDTLRECVSEPLPDTLRDTLPLKEGRKEEYLSIPKMDPVVDNLGSTSSSVDAGRNHSALPSQGEGARKRSFFDRFSGGSSRD
jgi:hypothetical protein